MADHDDIEARLWRWAEYVKGGSSGAGYPVKCTLHEDWSPPSPGMTPTMKVIPANDAPSTHRIIAQMTAKHRAALVARYVMRLTYAAAGLAMECQEETARARTDAAQRELARMLGTCCNMP
jgi:DNA-directed RNA polymerase specialized sigma24 family protein